MTTLAVAHREETFERIRDPLGDRGIRVEHVPYTGRVIPLSDPPWNADGFDVGFVFPGRVMSGSVLDAVLRVPWVNDRETVLTSRNKAGVLAALGAAGVRVPETVFVSNPADRSDVADALDRLRPPVVVKPNSTTRGTGVLKVHDRDSALGAIDYLDLLHDFRATADRSYLLQEFVDDARDYRAMVLDGEFVGAVERRQSDDAGWKHNVHRGATARGVDLPHDLRRLAERAADALDASFLGVDLLVTDDRSLVVETNARPTVDAATKYEPDFYDRLAALVERVAAGRR